MYNADSNISKHTQKNQQNYFNASTKRRKKNTINKNVCHFPQNLIFIKQLIKTIIVQIQFYTIFYLKEKKQ